MTGTGDELLRLLEGVQSIARSGLHYRDDPYERERYEKLLELVADAYEHALDVPAAQARARLAGELGHITPKVGAEGALFDEGGRVLVMRRADDGTWCLPGGWLDPNEAPAHAVEREMREETGLTVAVTQLVDAFFRPAGTGYGPHSAVALVYLCERRAGELVLSHEGEELAFRHVDDVPRWHERHETYARAAADAHQNHVIA